VGVHACAASSSANRHNTHRTVTTRCTRCYETVRWVLWRLAEELVVAHTRMSVRLVVDALTCVCVQRSTVHSIHTHPHHPPRSNECNEWWRLVGVGVDRVDGSGDAPNGSLIMHQGNVDLLVHPNRGVRLVLVALAVTPTPTFTTTAAHTIHTFGTTANATRHTFTLS